MKSEIFHKAAARPSKLPRVDVVTISSNCTFPRHSHDHFGIGWIVSGAQRSWSGRGIVEASTDDVITVNPNEIHDGLPIDSKVRSWRMLFFRPDVVGNLLGRSVGSLELKYPVLKDVETSRKLQKLFSQIEAGEDHAAHEAATLMLDDIFGYDAYADVYESPTVSQPIQLILERINDNPCRVVCLAELAAVSGMSRTGLLRRFRREIGATPSAYAMQLRIRHAQHLVKSGIPLIDVALQTGFADQSHLTRAFKRQVGISPGRYQNSLGYCNIVQDPF